MAMPQVEYQTCPEKAKFIPQGRTCVFARNYRIAIRADT
jgi:hypothetical protein